MTPTVVVLAIVIAFVTGLLLVLAGHALTVRRERRVRAALRRRPAADPDLVHIDGQPLPPVPSRPLPHRPAPGSESTGRRHRLADAHTGSLSATQLLELVKAAADARHQQMLDHANDTGRR